MKNSKHSLLSSFATTGTCSALALLALVSQASALRAQVQGPSSSRTPYLVNSAPNAGVVRNITSIVTTTDLVPLTGQPASPYEVAGILDGLGAFDNGNGTVTVIACHELGNTVGSIRKHGARGTFLSALIVDKTTLQVLSASDVIESIVDAAGVLHNGTNANAIALGRFCSGDLPPVTAFFNSTTGLGTSDRIFLCGEEGNTGWLQATVVTGSEKGLSYYLPAFNVLGQIGGWENALASPFAQDMTVVAATNDGGTGVMNNTVNIYVGQKQATGTVAEKAGLKNGTNFFVSVVGNPVEIVNSTTRATNITTGTRFSLSASSGTTFSRPEDGAWDPSNPRDFYFVTTDRLDTLTNTGANQTIGASGAAQNGRSRLWRLRFDSISNPALGGEVALLIDGSKNGQKVNMLDNMCVGGDGFCYLTEDPGNSTYLGKTWAYDPATDTLVQLAKFDSARWGELAVNGGTPGALSPHTNDKEISGVIDVSDIFPHAADETVLLIDVQDHSTNPAVANANTVEGGQLLLFRVALGAQALAFGASCSTQLAAAPASAPVLGSTFVAEVSNVHPAATVFMMVGASDTTFLGLPLPLALDFLNVPGCFLYQDLALEGAGATVATSPTTAQYSLPIPASYSFTGFTVYLQSWNGYPAGAQVSNGLKVVLGL